MQSSLLLPLFPLQVVLLPGAILPLHIFEERYKEMIGEAIRDQSEFGVMLATPDGIAHVGCAAKVERVLKQYPDGRLDIITRGMRRFELLLVNEERSFLRGSVEFFDDDLAVADAELLAEAVSGHHEYRLLSSDEPYAPPNTAAPLLSFTLADPVSDLSVRQELLGLRTEPERLKRLCEFFTEWNARQRQAHRAKKAAGQNGHPPQRIQ
jgi:Lon protease-like protein